MPVFARLRTRRLALVAAAVAIGLVASAVTVTVAPVERASAANANLLCDNNTVYGIIGAAGGGNAVGDLVQIDATTGAGTKIGTITPGSNALGLTKNGTQLWAYQGNSANVIRYDVSSGVSTAFPTGGASISAIRGGVNPVNNIYYYATGGTPTTIYGFNTITNVSIGEVGTFAGGKGSNGDLAFGTDGTLYLVDSDQVFSIANLPTTAGTAALTGTLVTTLPSGTNSPGIAYSSDGYLYLVANTTSSTLYEINPGTGTVKAAPTMSTGANVYDLATCNYANSLRTKADVRSRAATTDQFTLTNNGFTVGNTATTTGTATGIQTAVAGPSLAVGGLTYSVTQTASGTTDLANYSVGWTCVNNTTSTTVASGTGNTASFSYPTATTADGSDVVCTFLDAVKPVAVADANGTTANTALAVTAPGVLQNDTGATIAVTSTSAVATTQGGSATVNSNGSYSYTPQADFSGVDTFDYTIADVNGTTSSTTVTITVTPTAGNDTEATGVNTPVGITDLLVNDHGSVVKVQSVDSTSANGGTVSLDSTTGDVTYTPATGYVGTDSFTYVIVDSSGQTTQATVQVTVAPGAVNDSATTPANTPVTTQKLTANDHPSTSVAQSVEATSLHGGTETLNTATGTATYTPPTDYSGPDSFHYTATDPASGATFTGTVNITVTPTAVDDLATTPAGVATNVPNLKGNDHATSATVTSITQPAASVGTAVLLGDGSVTFTPAADFSGVATIPYVLTDSSNQTTTADVVVTVTPVGQDDSGTTPVNVTLNVSAADGLLANDSGSLTVTGHSGVTHGSLTVNTDGSYVYIPTTDYSGPDAFDYTATDSNGATVTQQVVLTVTPTAANDNATTSVNQPINVAVRGNDFGTNLTIVSVGAAGHGGSAVIDNGITIDYTPGPGYSGTDTVAYQVRDASGQTVGALLRVSITPSAGPDSAGTTVGAPVTIPQATLIINDVGTTLSVTAITSPASHGTAVRNNDGSVTYTPAGGYSGPDSFVYEVTDPTGNTATATVTMTVGNQAAADTGTTPVNTLLVKDAAHSVLANDLGSPPMTATLATGPTHGTVTLNSDGSYQYMPTSNYSGPDSFQYTATDSSNNTATGTVSIMVTPTSGNDTVTTNAGMTYTSIAPGVLGNDVGTLLTATIATPPTHGTATLSSDGALQYVPAPNYSGPDSFTYTAKDASNQTQLATVSITVKPVALAADPSTTVGTPVTVDAAHGLLVGASGSGLVATLDTPPSHGTVVVNPDGSYTYTPNPGFTGDDSFTFTVTDSSNQTTGGTATVTVEPLAEAKNDQLTAKSGQPITVPVLNNDSAQGGATFDLATLRLIDPTTSAPVLQTTIAGVGTWDVVGSQLKFTPVPGYVGTASAAYQITDTAGQTVTATAAVVYPQLSTLALAHTGTDAGEFDGLLGGGMVALLLGLLLLLVPWVRGGRIRRAPRHSTVR